MDIQRLYSLTRQAIEDFSMIEEGDKIAIGVSGGKDSLALLYALAGLQRFYPKHFDIIAITADLGYGELDVSPIEKICEELRVEYHVVKTQIADIVKEKVSKGTYCAMCAKLRKGALNSFAKEMGCNKIAYAHHQDDMIETMLLSLFYEGQFFSFPPAIYYREADISVIRPMIYVKETEVKSFIKKQGVDVVKNLCPHDGITRRAYVKRLLQQLSKDNPEVKKKMFNAIMKGKIYEY